MTPKEFKDIRLGLMLKQGELAHILGYAHKIRISEFERGTNPLGIPAHIQWAMRHLASTPSSQWKSKYVLRWHDLPTNDPQEDDNDTGREAVVRCPHCGARLAG